MNKHTFVVVMTLGALLGLSACKKPAPAPVVDQAAEEAKKRAAEEARRKAEEEARRKQVQEQEEAKRKAAAEEVARKKTEADRKAAEEQAFRNAATAALKDINFDYDKYAIRETDKAKLQGIADFLRKYPDVKLKIEGHCDERGTVEYNMTLGEKRAAAAMAYLKNLGVAESRLSTISYGKERPKVQGKDEESYLVNRRCEFKQQ